MVARQRHLVLGLPTGQTVIPLYAELRNRLRAPADCGALVTFNVDEFVGLTADDPGSFRHFLQHHLLAHLPIHPAQMHFLDGGFVDLDAACGAYEDAIQVAGGIDLQLLGIGVNGHIGFNEPGAALEARTHRVRLLPETRRANAAWFNGHPEAVPQEALSMGMATILGARRIMLLATGAAKAAAVAGAVTGPITTQLPASFLQLHHDVELYLDAEAASRLPEPTRRRS